MSIKAMEQAIEALNEAVAFREGGRQKAIDAINALRAALSQQSSDRGATIHADHNESLRLLREFDEAMGDSDDWPDTLDERERLKRLVGEVRFFLEPRKTDTKPSVVTPEPVHATVRNLLLELLNEPDRTLQQRPDRFRRVREAYELLYTRPAPSVFLVRDIASLLNASVPDVCNALAELGYEPRRSTNAAISPDEALAVASRISPAPSVPDDVALTIHELRHLADKFSEGWHEGIKIDAMDVMLLSDAARKLEIMQAAMLAASSSKKDGAT